MSEDRRFIHIPKTAGVSIIEGLAKFSPGRFDINREDEKVAPNFTVSKDEKASKTNADFTFSFIRNPWDRFISAYCYLHNKISRSPATPAWGRRSGERAWEHAKEGKKSRSDFVLFPALGAELLDSTDETQEYNKYIRPFGSFKDFVKNGSIEGQHFRPMTHWIDTELDFIGRFESLRSDFDTLCNMFSYSRMYAHNSTRFLPHRNKSNHKPYWEYYDDETEAIIGEKYAEDIEKFGYKFK